MAGILKEDIMAEKDIVTYLTDTAMGIINESKAVWETLDEVSEWSSIQDVIDNVVSMSGLIGYITKAIAMAAERILDDVSNEEKLNAAVAVLDRLLPMPWYLESVDGPIIKWVVSTVYQLIKKK